MTPKNEGVSVYRVYRGDTAIHLQNTDTHSDTATDTPTLKALAFSYLSKENAIHTAIQNPIHTAKKCITPKWSSDTLLEGENMPPHEVKNTPEDDHPTPEQVNHARRLIVDCPMNEWKVHIWYCARCQRANQCGAWRHLREEVELMRESGKPYSLHLAETLKEAVEVAQ